MPELQSATRRPQRRHAHLLLSTTTNTAHIYCVWLLFAGSLGSAPHKYPTKLSQPKLNFNIFPPGFWGFGVRQRETEGDKGDRGSQGRRTSSSSSQLLLLLHLLLLLVLLPAPPPFCMSLGTHVLLVEACKASSNKRMRPSAASTRKAAYSAPAPFVPLLGLAFLQVGSFTASA